ncbi:MAG: hypothetical protein K1X68_02155 [Saprospiraceae bacterium]|nr:hypothetical protein [Saprospiraceae bacterium]HNA65431.1 hypothetical protein [Saprospiraceae bacterium]HNG70228.1 hypothetical protein [Saprospiraceae bacterium]HNL05531.1 hypothetical protein [Bacteroidia bacterium]
MKTITAIIALFIVQYLSSAIFSQDNNTISQNAEWSYTDYKHPDIFTSASNTSNLLPDSRSNIFNGMEVKCKSNVTLDLSKGGIGVLNYKDVLLSGPMGNGLKYYLGRSQFDCDDIPERIVVLIVTDSLQNMDTCQTRVVIKDITSPTISCMTQTEVQLNATGQFEIKEPKSYIMQYRDNCFLDINKTVSDKSIIDCNDKPAKKVVFTVTDEGGNASTCITNFVVKDSVKPQIRCLPQTTIDVTPGTYQINFKDYSQNSFISLLTDNCTVKKTIFNPSETNLKQFGTTKVQLQIIAEDDSGNSAECTTEVIIRKQIKAVPSGKIILKEE